MGADEPRRVLIVEDDPVLAMSTVRECLRLGLEPKLCLGAERSSECPGLAGSECPRTRDVVATLVSVVNDRQRVAAPACVGGKLVVSETPPLVGRASVGVLEPDACIDYPYDPNEAAALLRSLVRNDRTDD